MRLTDPVVLKIAAAAECDPRTVVRVLEGGERQRASRAKERIDAAMKKLKIKAKK